MSKLEKALQKSRTAEGVQTMSPALEGSQQLVPKKMELRPFRHEINRMAEPWRLSVADMAEERIIFPEMHDRRVIDAFRSLRTRIVQEAPGGNASILVTSVADDGGSSFVALNLAVAFTLDAAKTAVLIDGNLRNPSFEFLTMQEMEHGLTDYLEEEIDAGEIVRPAGIPRLRLIPAGRKSENSTEHLDSKKMRELITNVRMRYQDRYVIMDSASIGTSADAQVLAQMADFVLLVVPYGKTTEAEIWHAVQAIDEHKFLGVVFNDEPDLPKLTWN